MNLPRLLVPLMLLAWVAPLPAQDEPGVQGTVVVPDRGAGARNEAMPAALAAALQRLSPEPNAGERIDTAAALSADETLLQRFEYQQVTRPTASGIPSIRLLLHAWFRAVPARELLVRAGLPVWRGGRAAPTLWLIDETEEFGRRLYGAEAEAVAGLLEWLEPRGVRVLWPMNDLHDLRMVDALDEGGIAQALADAAQRSAADPPLLAWVRYGSDGAGIDWHLGSEFGAEHPPVHFTSSGAGLAEALVSAAPRLISVLADRYSVRPAALAATGGEVDRGPGEYRLWLENLRRAGAYAEATTLLAGQPVVSAMTPEHADGDRVRVRVQISAPLGQLLALLAADGRLLPVSTPPGDADLSLRWRD